METENKAVLISVKPKWCELIADGKDLSKFRFYERKQNNDIRGMIQSLQNSNTNCRRKLNWR